MTASLPVPNDIDPEEPDGHTSARVVRLSDNVTAAAEKPRGPRSPRKGGAKGKKAAQGAPVADPGPPPPLPSDLDRVASAAAGIVVPPRPPLPPTADTSASTVDEPDAAFLDPEVEATTPARRHDGDTRPAPVAPAVGPESSPAAEPDSAPLRAPAIEAVADPEPAVADPEPAVADPEPAVADPEPAVADPEPAVADPEPAVADPEPAVAEPEPPVADPVPFLADPESVVADPEPTATVASPPAAPAPAPRVAEPPPAPHAVTDAASVAPAPERRPIAAGNALELRGVTKSFGATNAVDGIDLTVPAGTFYGLVGPNGAGKTTTLSMIAGLLEPDRGTIHVGGVDAAAKPLAAKKLMGVLPDRLRTFDRLTGRQLLYYYGVLRKLPPSVVESRTADLARAFDLEDALGRSVSDYSAGMLKKVMLAGALIHSPRLLVLDEPFEAVDPVSSAIILDILSTYVAHGGTVILSSHGMELVERVCTRVAVIVAGQVLAEGTVDEVRGELTLEQRFVELAGGLSDVEGLEWLHTFSD